MTQGNYYPGSIAYLADASKMWERGADGVWHEKNDTTASDIINNIQTNLIDYIDTNGQCVLNAPVRTIQVRSEDDLALIVAAGYGAGTRAYLPDESTMWECDAAGQWHDVTTNVSEDIQAAVTEWLDDHPEATTTVTDGSITKQKLDANLQGTVDDVAELQELTGNAHKIVFTEGGYVNATKNPLTYAVTAEETYRYAIIDCQPGDTFVLNGHAVASTSGAARLWVFGGEGGARVDISPGGVDVDNLILTAPEGAEKLVINQKVEWEDCFTGTP